MNDSKTTFAQLKNVVKAFNDEREWNQFHTPKNLSMKLSVEAAELMEIFTWCNSKESKEVVSQKMIEVQDEIADIVVLALCFANATGIDLAQAIENKIAKNAQKYPVEKCKGRSNKYTEYK